MSLSMWQTVTAARMRKADVAAAGTGAGASMVVRGGVAVVIGGWRRASPMINGRGVGGWRVLRGGGISTRRGAEDYEANVIDGKDTRMAFVHFDVADRSSAC